MTKEVVQKSKRSKTSGDDSSLVRGTVRTRGDEEIMEETKKPKRKCLKFCNVYVEKMESKLIEIDPTLVVTSNQQSAETREAWKIDQHEKMKYFVAVEERAITTSSAAVLSTLMARNIVKKISTEGTFPCGAVNEGMEPQMSVDDMQLFVCEVTDKNVEEEYMEEINVSAKKCYEPESRHDFVWDDLKNRKMHVCRKVPVQK